MSVKIKSNKVSEAFLKAVLRDSYAVRVGVLGVPKGTNVSAQDRKKRGSGKSKGKKNTSISVVEVARIHEFGTRTIPKRSFLLSTYKRSKTRWIAAFKKLIKNVSGADEYLKQLNLFGALMQRDVRLTFTNNNWKPLKYRDGTPLVDTGQLRRAIAWSVEKDARR